MTDEKPKCQPCHGNCNQGRTCPNKASPIEEESQVTFVTMACVAFVVVCLTVLFFGEHAQ